MSSAVNAGTRRLLYVTSFVPVGVIRCSSTVMVLGVYLAMMYSLFLHFEVFHSQLSNLFRMADKQRSVSNVVDSMVVK